MKIRYFFIILGLLILVGVFSYISVINKATSILLTIDDIVPALPDSPYNASFLIDGVETMFVDGYVDVEGMNVRFYGKQVETDSNKNGYDDMLMLLLREKKDDPIYYVAVAVNDGEGYIGTNTVLLPLGKTPQTVNIWHDLVTVQYEDKDTRYFVIEGVKLGEIGPFEEDEVQAGLLVYGHESHTFTPCGSEESFWISPESNSLMVLELIYMERTEGKESYTSVFVVLSGNTEKGLEEGFGADFEQSFLVQSILSAEEGGECEVTHKTTEDVIE